MLITEREFNELKRGDKLNITGHVYTVVGTSFIRHPDRMNDSISLVVVDNLANSGITIFSVKEIDEFNIQKVVQ